MGREEKCASISTTTEPPPHCQVPLIASPPPPHGSPSSACQALQITTHANKSLETRTANVGLPWRPTPGAGSPGGRPVAQVCCGESWEGQNAWRREDNALYTIGVLIPGRAMGFATFSPSCPQGPSPAHVQLVRCDKCCTGFGKQVQPGPVGQWAQRPSFIDLCLSPEEMAGKKPTWGPARGSQLPELVACVWRN